MANLDKFIDQAIYWAVTHKAGHGNKYHQEICDIMNMSTKTAWCAAFVSACAIKSGNKGVIGSSKGAGGICQKVINRGGTWIKGPHVTHSKVVPQRGDLLLKHSSKYPITYDANGKRTSKLHGKHVAIVYKVSSTHVYTYEGNYGNEAAKVKRKLTDTSIAGYARPKWGTGDAPLYKTKNDRHDMTIREIGYMNSNGSLTTSDSGVHISLINYTTLLGDLYDMFARNKYGQTIVNTDKLKGNEKIVVDYLLSEGFNVAAACGIAANIKTDSNYNPATQVDSYYGICKWTGTTAGLMRASAGATSWATNLSGQLDFLLGDLQESYTDLLSTLYSTDVSSAGAAKAATEFSKTYRNITKTTTRETVAKSIYSNIVTTKPVTVGTTPPSTPQKDTATIVNISKLTQKALAGCWRYMDVGTCDSSIMDEWKSKGSSTQKGLTYLDGCYLVSTHSSLACKVNDYLEVTLNGAGTMKCIVGGLHNDTKTPLQIYRPRSSNINLKDWSTTQIKQIKDFGPRK